jgi:hypothetical protein
MGAKSPVQNGRGFLRFWMESPPFRFDLPSRAMRYPTKEYRAMQSVPNCTTFKKRPSPGLCTASDRTRLLLIPYIGPEFIAAILGREINAAPDLSPDSKSATENSLPARCSQSAVNEEAVPVPVPFQGKESWLRCSHLFAIVARVVALSGRMTRAILSRRNQRAADRS